MFINYVSLYYIYKTNIYYLDMNKTHAIILSIIISLFFLSCEKNNQYEKSTIEGQWTTVERYIEIDNEFLSESFKNLFYLDNQKYVTKRTFTKIEENIGSVSTIAISRETNMEERSRKGTYELINDSLHINDEKFLQTMSVIRLDSRTLISYTKLKKIDLDKIYTEIGGDPNLIPDSAEGILKMREVK